MKPRIELDEMLAIENCWKNEEPLMIEYDEERFIEWDDYDHEPWSELELVDDDADYLYYEDEYGTIIRKEKARNYVEDEESEEQHHGVL